MARGGGKATPIDAGIVARVSGVVRGAISGARDAWFGPAEPVAPAAPEEVRGRQFDYPIGINISGPTPRSESGENGINFDILRRYADPTQGGLDLLRLAVETRKDQMESQRWTVRGKDGKDGGDRAKYIAAELRFPDGVHTFAQWQRMLLDDLLVIDAPSIYFAPSTKGHRIPQVMDGALLKRLLRPDGRTPLPPEFAYQQALKGLPAVDYTLDEILQMPRNLRSHRVYGMSPVEQVISTVDIALRRQMTQREHYTAGSIPDAVSNVPETWTPDQIKQFQGWWDSIFSGNTEEQRRLRFVPSGVGITMLKPEVLKDPFDEWLARIICYAFSLSPQALVKEMNRATAQTSKQTAQEEGLEPLKNWFKDTMDAVLLKAFGVDDLEFAYVDEEIADPAVKAEVCATALGKGGGKAWWTQDEVRAKFGDEPLTPAQHAELNPPAPEPVAPGALPDENNPDDQKRNATLIDGLSKVARSLRPRAAPKKLDVNRNEKGEIVAIVAAEQ